MKTIKNETITEDLMFSIIELLKRETKSEINLLNLLLEVATEEELKESETLKEIKTNIENMQNVLNEFIYNFKDKNKIEIKLFINGEEKTTITNK